MTLNLELGFLVLILFPKIKCFQRNTGQRNTLQFTADEQCDRFATQLISGNLIQNQSLLLFPTLYSPNNFATIDDEVRINPKIDSSFDHFF